MGGYRGSLFDMTQNKFAGFWPGRWGPCQCSHTDIGPTHLCNLTLGREVVTVFSNSHNQGERCPWPFPPAPCSAYEAEYTSRMLTSPSTRKSGKINCGTYVEANREAIRKRQAERYKNQACGHEGGAEGDLAGC